ncbi:uncharacterized protein J7T54_007589 [Emericellopsis cladophorae]|uniref:Uncharacterized protein n=1 Tax=Emericellopsis cladophorae TaxID=2686198 RepID=A0A9Q0BCI1_9HYPO|nr:uncharacterized protein J7T54_007589 [Emericellopsis cladophorae]KAI6779134.1 hypothetical protein J7T54_007589 [Emericellopsis cladophorae]
MTVPGNVHGAFSRHLCASRHLAKSLVARRSMSAENDQLCHESPFTNGLLGFRLELYTYTMLCNLGVHPPSTEPVADLLFMSFENMSKFPTFGVPFAGSHKLYRVIPEIDALPSRRRVEKRNDLARPITSLMQDNDSLHSRLSGGGGAALLAGRDRETETEFYNWSGMGHVGMMADVLQLLWDNPDPEAFGPHGLKK